MGVLKYLVSLAFVVFLVVQSGCGQGNQFDWNDVTPLDEYVWRDLGDEDVYRYELYDTILGDGYTYYILNMTSLKWYNSSVLVEEDLIWWHWLIVVIPDNLRITDTALLYIHGGNRNDSVPLPSSGDPNGTYPPQRVITLALETGAIAAAVFCVPFQPVTFVGETVPRREDRIIAKTWRLFIEEIDDPDIVVLLPMVRAARRAVDTVVDFTTAVEPRASISKIVPTGRSKRGWASWLLASTDRRVIATVPVVLTLLSSYDNIYHHYQSYDGWSWAFSPYYEEGLPRYINNSRTSIITTELALDPLVYNPRLSLIPKLVVSGSADEFFLSDDANYFWTSLGGVKYYQMMENTGHGLDGQNNRLFQNIANFFTSILENPGALPKVSWSRYWEEGVQGAVTVQADRPPRYVKAWWADTTNETYNTYPNENRTAIRKDFRLTTISSPSNPIMWYEAEVEDLGFNTYRFAMEERVDEGYREFWIQIGFDGPVPGDPYLDLLDFTTEVQIIPDTLPFPRCATERECQGVIR